VSPVAPYIGGKKALFKRLVPLIDGHDHLTYAEPFVGMGGIFLKRTSRPKAEIINDWSQDIATFYRILQRHYVAFLDMLRFQLTTRSDFERLLATDPSTLTDLERAARFLYLQRTAFGGKVNGRSFGVSVDRPARLDITRLVPILEDVHERLASVTIERLPYQTFIERYDRPATLFFLDPPYWGNENDYGAGMFGREDFGQLKSLLGRLKGSFIMTLNDRPEVRELFAEFDLKPVSLKYSIGSGSVPARELIISRLR
jgi:DNA adenine methylase